MTLDELIAALQAHRANAIAGRFEVRLNLDGLDDEALVTLVDVDRDDRDGAIYVNCSVLWD
jgi:hypothetical protein